MLMLLLAAATAAPVQLQSQSSPIMRPTGVGSQPQRAVDVARRYVRRSSRASNYRLEQQRDA